MASDATHSAPWWRRRGRSPRELMLLPPKVSRGTASPAGERQSTVWGHLLAHTVDLPEGDK